MKIVGLLRLETVTTAWVMFCLTLISASTFSATYYVKPTGNDALDGLSEGNAWEHVQMACTTLTAGDTAFIRAGTYDENSPYGSGIGSVNA